MLMRRGGEELRSTGWFPEVFLLERGERVCVADVGVGREFKNSMNLFIFVSFFLSPCRLKFVLTTACTRIGRRPRKVQRSIRRSQCLQR